MPLTISPGRCSLSTKSRPPLSNWSTLSQRKTRYKRLPLTNLHRIRPLTSRLMMLGTCSLRSLWQRFLSVASISRFVRLSNSEHRGIEEPIPTQRLTLCSPISTRRCRLIRWRSAQVMRKLVSATVRGKLLLATMSVAKNSSLIKCPSRRSISESCNHQIQRCLLRFFASQLTT